MREAIRDIDRLRHIDECIEHISDYLSGKSFEDMKADMMCYHAVVYNNYHKSPVSMGNVYQRPTLVKEASRTIH